MRHLRVSLAASCRECGRSYLTFLKLQLLDCCYVISSVPSSNGAKFIPAYEEIHK